MSVVGIDAISFSTGHYSLSLEEMARHYSIDKEKYHVGLGQYAMSVCGREEDVVTMAAEAARPVIEALAPEELASVRTLLFATETGVDFSKSAGMWLHKLIALPSSCRVVELKQACYSGTAALRLAASLVATHPSERVLVATSDIARYPLGSPGEVTEGCGAVAMLIASNPRIAQLGSASGIYSEDVMDFWRPNYSRVAHVDGKYSMRIYLRSLQLAFEDYLSRGGVPLKSFSACCFHAPFAKMAVKALHSLVKSPAQHLERALEASLRYTRRVGNAYSASLYTCLLSLLDAREITSEMIGNHCEGGGRVGLFSYGSGAVAEFFDLKLVPGYEQYLLTDRHQALIQSRKALSYEAFARWHEAELSSDGGEHAIARDATCTDLNYRFCGLFDHQRRYEVLV